MLEVLKVIILGIVQGITEWLPISSTGHLILVEQLIQLKQNEAFTNMFNVVIQFGSILAVVVIYFHKLNPFSPTKTEKQKKMTIQLWIKVVIGTIPALIGGVLLNDLIESKLSNAYVVALMLIVYGILFIVIEKRNETREPKVKRLSQLSVKTVLLIGVFLGRPDPAQRLSEHWHLGFQEVLQQSLHFSLQFRLCLEQVH